VIRLPLKKLCRCGKKVIDYKDKYCDECSKKINKEKSEKNRLYDKECRNKDSSAIYHSKEWSRLTELCRSRFNRLDIYSLYVLNSIEYGTICHHIEEVTDSKERIYDLQNLILLSGSNHNTIHYLYKKDYEGTKKMLFELIERWKKEMLIDS
jgi:5-methylcytosine-specific restriction enzyme A